MASVKIIFHRIIQDIQDVDSANTSANHMVSRAFFSLEAGGQTCPDLSVDMRQPFGTQYAAETLEVDRPKGLPVGTWNQNAFHDIAEDYYRVCLSHLISSPNSPTGLPQSIRMRNNSVERSAEYVIEIPD